MSDKSFKELSRRLWQRSDGQSATIDELQLGCLQRIADATEAMSKNYVQAQMDAEYWKQQYYHERNRREMFERSIRTHKANYTRLKKKFEETKKNGGDVA